MVAARGGTTHRGRWRLLVGSLCALLFAAFVGSAAGPAATLAADPELSAAQQRVENVIAAARQYVGVPYRVGTEGPSLFDCSGLVFRAFSDASLVDRISGNRLRAAGYMRWFARQGLMTANEEEAQRGDLVVYDNGRHIGIYLGEGRTISALLSGVTVHSLHGISQEVTGFLRPDWSGEGQVPPFVPVDLPDVLEEPAVLVPASDWIDAFEASAVVPVVREGRERVELRTPSSRTFENGDGTFTTEFHAQPIHYLAPDSGRLEPIDLGFAINDRSPYPTVRKSPVRLTARPAADGAGLLSAEALGLSVTLALPRAATAEAQPAIVDDGRAVDYFDLFGRGVGLRVIPAPDGFRGFLVLADEPDRNRFTFVLDAAGLVASIDDLGDLLLTDETGATVARVPRPVLLDSSDSDGQGGGLDPGAASFELTADGERMLLSLVVKPRFLAEAAYPAYLDLALTGFAGAAPAADMAFVSSRHPDAALGGFARPEAAGAAELLLGRQPRTRHESRALLRFNDLRSTLGTVDVASASLELLPYLQRDEEVPALIGRLAGEWSAATLTWNTLPATVHQLGQLVGPTGAWLSADVSTYVTDVLSRGATDYGLTLYGEAGTNGTWKRILLGDLGPRLVVTWSGLRPTPDAATADAPTLGWSLPALAGEQERFEVELSHDGFVTTDYASGTVKGRSGRQLEWSLPEALLTAGGDYEWRVRVRIAGDGWSEWSAAQVLSVEGAPLAPQQATLR